MSNHDIYQEFSAIQEQMTDNIQQLSASLVLADERVNNAMVKDKTMLQHVEMSRKFIYAINSNFMRMIGCFNKAYAQLKSNIDESVDGLAELICEQDNKLEALTHDIASLTRMLVYENPSKDYTTIAKFMLENIRLDNGTLIKGKNINIQNLAYILMKYDEIKDHQRQISKRNKMRHMKANSSVASKHQSTMRNERMDPEEYDDMM